MTKSTSDNSGLYLIAEAGVNHGGDLTVALEMVKQAALAGWDAIKFQTYKAGRLAHPSLSPHYWDLNSEATESQFELFGKFDGLKWQDYVAISQEANAWGIDFMTTVFDHLEVSKYAELMKRFKVASADLTNFLLLEEIAATGKPVILSTGAASFAEIRASLDFLKMNGAEDVELLHCVLNYPLDIRNSALERILALRETFPGYRVGYSDHTSYSSGESDVALLLAYSSGARTIEKHFTLDPKLVGNDHYHSADPRGLMHLRQLLVSAQAASEPFSEEPYLEGQEAARTNARRKLFAAEFIKPGEHLTKENVVALRASLGLDALTWPQIKGCSVNMEIPRGAEIKLSMLDSSHD